MSKYQSKIIKYYEERGWFVVNLIKTNKNGIPDLLCLKDGFKPLFIESKEAKDTVKKLQEYRLKEVKKYGANSIILHQGKDPIII